METQRIHGLDFCRAVFMCLGLFFHCGLIYGKGQNWRVVSEETNTLIGLFSNFIHHFRMESFYLVSGFFYLLIFMKGRDGFLNDRILRALIPMIVVGFSLNIGMNYMSYNRDYNWGWGYVFEGQWLGHLWFLGNLIVYFFLAAPLSQYLTSHSHKMSVKRLLIVFVGLVMLALSGQLMSDYFDFRTFVFINFGYLVYYFAYFTMGIVAHYSGPDFYQLIAIRRFPIYLACYGVIQVGVKLGQNLSDTTIELCKSISHFPLMLAAFSLLYFIGNRKSKIIAFLSDASYTVYLLHQPLIIVLYVAIFQYVQWGAVTEYTLLIALVFTLSAGFHWYVVKRYATVRLLLNGVAPTHKSPRSQVQVRRNKQREQPV